MDNLDIIQVVKHVPNSQLERLNKDDTSDISQCGQLVNHYIQGKIWKKFKLCPYQGKGKLLKMILEDEAGKINVFCLGDYACDIEKLTVGDTLIISNGYIETSPHYDRDGIHKYHLIIGNKDQPCHVWAIPQSTFVDATHENTMSPKKTIATPSARSNNPPGSSKGNVGPPAAMSNHQQQRHGNDAPVARSGDQPATSNGNVGPSTVSNQQQHCIDAPVARSDKQPETSTGDIGPTTFPNQQQQQHGNDAPVTRTPKRQVAAPAQNKSPKQRPYMYTRLADVKETNCVNVYGVVKFFKPPRKTRGTDYFMALTIIDPSLVADPSDPDGIGSGLKCNLFRRELKALPQVLRVGDIVRLHRIKVQKYNNELQAMCTPGFASVVFNGRMGTPMKPRSSTADYTVSQDDKDKVRELQRWANTVMHSDGLTNPSRALTDVFIGQYFDLTCQVVAKALLPSESCVLLKVWDGTKCSWPVRDIDVGGRPMEWDHAAAFRAEGLTVDVCLYDDHVPAGEKIQPGNYICLYNLHALKYTPPAQAEDHPVSMGEFCLHRGTSYGRGVTVMSQYDPDIIELIRKLDDVNRNCIPASSSSSSNHRPSAQATASDTRCLSPSRDTADEKTGSSQVASELIRNLDDVNRKNGEPASSSSSTNNKPSAQATASDTRRLSPSRDTADEKTGSSQVASATRRLHFNKSSNPVSPGRSDENRQVEPRGQQSNPSRSSHCMQRSASIVTDHVHIKVTSIADVKAYKEPYLFRIRARVADFLPNDIADFVILFCPKCRLRCKVPHPQISSLENDEDTNATNETSGMQTRRSRRKRAGTSSASEDEKPRRHSPRKKPAARDTSNNDALRQDKRKKKLTNVARQQEIENAHRSSPRKVAVVHPSNMKKRRTAKRRVWGHKAMAELETNQTQSNEQTATVKVTIEDLSVQDALLLAHQGIKLLGYPHNVDSNSSHQGDLSTPVYYICPRCTPANRSTTNDEDAIGDDSGSLLQYQYCIKLFLQDDSGRIPVIVIGKNAETFFEDIPAVNLCENIDSKLNLEEYMRKLCPYPLELSAPSDEIDNSHPWLDACIMSYPAQVRGQRTTNYHLFHTVLALDVE